MCPDLVISLCVLLSTERQQAVAQEGQGNNDVFGSICNYTHLQVVLIDGYLVLLFREPT